MTRWSALLLAGSRPPLRSDKRDRLDGTKARILVRGEPMILRPLRALLESRQIGEVSILTQDIASLKPVIPPDPRVRFAKSNSTIAATIAALIERGDINYPALVTTADHALLDPAMVDHFTRESQGADLAIGVVDRRVVDARFPQTRRTWIGFRGASYTGANLFALGSARAANAVERWRSVEQDRKKGLQVLSALGPSLLLGAVLKLRTLHQSASAVGRKLGLTVRIVEFTDPKAAIDVDKDADLTLVEAILAGRA